MNILATILSILRGVVLFVLWISPPGLILMMVLAARTSKEESEAWKREYADFLRTVEGREFFCYTSRRNSRDWVESNILPGLAREVEVIFLDGKIPKCSLPQRCVSHVLCNLENVGFPNVMKVVNGKILDLSLHHELYDTINQNLPPERFMERLNDAQERLRTEAVQSAVQAENGLMA